MNVLCKYKIWSFSKVYLSLAHHQILVNKANIFLMLLAIALFLMLTRYCETRSGFNQTFFELITLLLQCMILFRHTNLLKTLCSYILLTRHCNFCNKLPHHQIQRCLFDRTFILRFWTFEAVLINVSVSTNRFLTLKVYWFQATSDPLKNQSFKT